MKQKYQTPATEVLILDTPLLMLTISGEQDSVGTGDEIVGDNTPNLISYRRGSWGNRWE